MPRELSSDAFGCGRSCWCTTSVPSQSAFILCSEVVSLQGNLASPHLRRLFGVSVAGNFQAIWSALFVCFWLSEFGFLNHGNFASPVVEAWVFLNPWNFAPPGNLRLRLSPVGPWTPGTLPLPLIEASRCCTLLVEEQTDQCNGASQGPHWQCSSGLAHWYFEGFEHLVISWCPASPCSNREPEESYFSCFKSFFDLTLQTAVLGDFVVCGLDQACGVFLPDDCRVNDQGYFILYQDEVGFHFTLWSAQDGFPVNSPALFHRFVG